VITSAPVTTPLLCRSIRSVFEAALWFLMTVGPGAPAADDPYQQHDDREREERQFDRERHAGM
jgi:hypothetical protein